MNTVLDMIQKGSNRIGIVALLSGFIISQAIRINAEEVVLPINGDVTMRFVKIGPGSFSMGTEDDSSSGWTSAGTV